MASLQDSTAEEIWQGLADEFEAEMRALQGQRQAAAAVQAATRGKQAREEVAALRARAKAQRSGEEGGGEGGGDGASSPTLDGMLTVDDLREMRAAGVPVAGELLNLSGAGAVDRGKPKGTGRPGQELAAAAGRPRTAPTERTGRERSERARQELGLKGKQLQAFELMRKENEQLRARLKDVRGGPRPLPAARPLAAAPPMPSPRPRRAAHAGPFTPDAARGRASWHHAPRTHARVATRSPTLGRYKHLSALPLRPRSCKGCRTTQRTM